MKTVSKLDIAKEMLIGAIEEYLEHQRYFVALNLAGVAEELFGKMVRIANGKDHLTEKVEEIQHLDEKMGWDISNTKELKYAINLSKNSIKHLDSENDLTVTINIENQARWKILSAIENYEKINSEINESIKEFKRSVFEKHRHNKSQNVNAPSGPDAA